MTGAAAGQEFENPLEGLSSEELGRRASEYGRVCGASFPELEQLFLPAAQLAQSPAEWRRIVPLRLEKERWALGLETSTELGSKWKLPKIMWLIVLVTSLSAATQGMDETVINGAQIFFLTAFGIENNSFLTGFVNGAPYLCCWTLGCWLTIPLNEWFGRRVAIAIASIVTILSCLGQACTTSTWTMFAARFTLGIGVGINSATGPILTSETAPAAVRGALAMQWQLFTAFGIMIGYAVSLAFQSVKDIPGVIGFNWRLMMAAPAIPAFFICSIVYFCPESPRWLMGKGRHADAIAAMNRIRHTKLQAVRDCFYANELMKKEEAINETDEKGKGPKLKRMYSCRRNRNALIATTLVMFTQQFCGVNIIAYYSSLILKDAGFTNQIALLVSFTLGLENFLFAIPAIPLIDRLGRRVLLLYTLPLMAIFLFVTGGAFYLPPQSVSHIALVLTGLYLFMGCYSPGPGPVPFTYCAEAWPLNLRNWGMSLNTATTWFFNWLLSLTFPVLRAKLSTPGVFFFYAGFCLLLAFACFFLIRETKGRTLEELDAVFDQSSARFIRSVCAWENPFESGKKKDGEEDGGDENEVREEDAMRVDPVAAAALAGLMFVDLGTTTRTTVGALGALQEVNEVAGDNVNEVKGADNDRNDADEGRDSHSTNNDDDNAQKVALPKEELVRTVTGASSSGQSRPPGAEEIEVHEIQVLKRGHVASEGY